MYRYLYDVVMKELRDSFGKALSLNKILRTENCKRVIDDSMYLLTERSRAWLFNIAYMEYDEMNVRQVGGYPLWNAYLRGSGIGPRLNAS